MKNLKITATLIALIFCSQFSKAQSRVKLENSVLWKIEHPDMKQASYLFGTVHLICEEDFKWMLTLNFNFTYWLICVLGAVLTFYALKEIFFLSKRNHK